MCCNDSFYSPIVPYTSPIVPYTSPIVPYTSPIMPYTDRGRRLLAAVRLLV